MGLFEKLKSVFGSSDSGSATSTGDADVTVEYAPDPESEHAVKGTDEAGPSGNSGPAQAEETAETDESGPETGASGDATTPEAGDTPDSPAVGTVKGIGPTYSERLGEASIETVADLASADAEAVADAAEVSVSRAENWIERARSRT